MPKGIYKRKRKTPVRKDELDKRYRKEVMKRPESLIRSQMVEVGYTIPGDRRARVAILKLAFDAGIHQLTELGYSHDADMLKAMRLSVAAREKAW